MCVYIRVLLCVWCVICVLIYLMLAQTPDLMRSGLQTLNAVSSMWVFGLVWSDPRLSRHLCLALDKRLFTSATGRLSWNSWVLCHQMFYRVGSVEEAGSKQGSRGGPALAGPAVRCSGCPFMGQYTNESRVLGPLWNIRGHSTPPDPQLHLHRNVIKF